MWPLTAALLLFFLQNPGANSAPSGSTRGVVAAPSADSSAEGLKALDEKKFDVAAECFTKAIAADPKDYSAYFNLALANTMLGKNAEAIAGYKKVLELKPGLTEAETNLGIVLLKEKQAGDAVPYLDAAASSAPKDFRARLYLSQALLESGDLEKAGQSYQAALALDAKSAAAELGLAHVFARQKRLADADSHFRRAAELDPGYRDGLLELASLYEAAGQKAEAMALYQQFPENAAARERLGQLLVESGRPAEGIPHLEWAVKRSPTSANRLALAQAYRKNHEPEKELPLLAEAVAAAPQDLDLRMAYGRELRDQRRYAEAAEQFAQVAQAKPDSVLAWNELAGMLVSLEKYPQALAALDRIRALGAETEGHWFLRALILDRLRDHKGALASYEKFLSMSSGKHPDEEFQARQRVRILKLEINKR
jgi:tetratricopeptide (TPR) repeat protein